MLGRKGQKEWTEVMMYVFVCVAMVIVIFQIPTIIGQISALFALGSAEAVAREVAGLATISGAAFDHATIHYVGSDSSFVYDLSIKDNIVHVYAMETDSDSGLSARSDESESSSGAGAMTGSSLSNGYSKIPFTISSEVEEKNEFTITKSVFEDGSNYNIEVK